MTTNPIFCAVDTNSKDDAKKLIGEIKENVGGIKLGLEFFTSCGPDAIKEIIAEGNEVFLDLKLHDIPNTVAKTIKKICELECFMTTVHTLGGEDMLRAARHEIMGNIHKPLLIGVTVLTSHNQITDIGITGSIESQVLRLAELAAKRNLDGVVCSPHEIEPIKKRFGNDLKLVVPGIRANNAVKNDQSRTLSAKEAYSLGADFLIIGRPITTAESPAMASKEIFKSLV